MKRCARAATVGQKVNIRQAKRGFSFSSSWWLRGWTCMGPISASCVFQCSYVVKKKVFYFLWTTFVSKETGRNVSTAIERRETFCIKMNKSCVVKARNGCFQVNYSRSFCVFFHFNVNGHVSFMNEEKADRVWDAWILILLMFKRKILPFESRQGYKVSWLS